MKLEDVVIGMTISIDKNLYAPIRSKYEINKFIVFSKLGSTREFIFWIYNVNDHPDTGIFTIDCADFEPYEEPKDGGYMINLDALENFGTNLGTGEKISPKEILDLFCQRGILMNNSDHLPITQEFIESFGFVKGKNHGDVVEFNKIVLDVKEKEEVKAELFYSEEVGYSLWIQTMTRDRLPVFVGYPCTTQSELRFLLTKGRIDCSK